MHGNPDAGPIDGDPVSSSPPDWPAPGTPLSGEEPTIELPVITEAMLAAHPPASASPLAAAALSLAVNRSTPGRPTPGESRPDEPTPGESAHGRPEAGELAAGPDVLVPGRSEPEGSASGQPAPTRGRRFPALERRGPRPGRSPASAAYVAALNDLLGPARDPSGRDGTATRPSEADATPVGGPDRTATPGHRRLVGAGIALTALLLTGAAVVVLSRDGDPGTAAPVDGRPPPAAPAHTVTGALAGRTEAGFDVIDGAERVTLRTAGLGPDLYRVSTPEAGAAVPRAEERDGRVRLRLDGDARAIDITLNAAVRWDLRVAGGAVSSILDLGAGRVGRVDLAGGADRIVLTLPRPEGTLTVRMSGGVNLFDVRAAARTPVRVRVGSGAGRVTLNGRDHAGVSAGRTFTAAAWAGAADRIDVDAAAGMSALTVAPY